MEEFHSAKEFYRPELSCSIWINGGGGLDTGKFSGDIFILPTRRRGRRLVEREKRRRENG